MKKKSFKIEKLFKWPHMTAQDVGPLFKNRGRARTKISTSPITANEVTRANTPERGGGKRERKNLKDLKSV